MMKSLTLLLAVWVLVTWSPKNASSDSYLPETPSAETKSVDYGQQAIMVDLVGLGFFLTSVALLQQDSPHFTTIGVSGAAAGAIWLLGGPVVHLTHGQSERATMSLAIRIGLPVVVGTLGAGIGEVVGDSDTSGLTYGFAGVAVGLVGAQITDWFYLSKANEPIDASQSRIRVFPMPTQGGMGVGIGGGW